MLVLLGGTGRGKSMLAEQVLRKVGETLELQAFLEVTVEDDRSLDLSAFRVNQHAGVLLDGVGDVSILHKHREVLQGRAKKCRGGRSNTMIYSYPFSLARCAVVVTVDLSATNLHLFRTDHWLADPRNVTQVWLQGSTWLANETNFSNFMHEGPLEQALHLWTVDELAARVSAEDAAGLAGQLQTNSVNGQDLVNMTLETAQTDLHFSPFAARKLMTLRELFLTR